MAAKKKKRTVDPAAEAMIACACEAGIDIAWDRLESQEPQCGFGRLGICCRNCTMGPCRIDSFGEGPQRGVCGATAETIVARGLLREVCAGTAAHSDHGREIIHALLLGDPAYSHHIGQGTGDNDQQCRSGRHYGSSQLLSPGQ